MRSIRYCPTCATEVEATTGECQRSHRLPVRSVDELRAEVDLAFERAMAEVAALTGEAVPGPRVARAGAPPPPPSAPARTASVVAPDVSPQAVPDITPPARATVWSELSADAVGDDTLDPIAAFAPSPRMDWGPARPSLADVRNLFHRPSEASV